MLMLSDRVKVCKNLILFDGDIFRNTHTHTARRTHAQTHTHKARRTRMLGLTRTRMLGLTHTQVYILAL